MHKSPRSSLRTLLLSINGLQARPKTGLLIAVLLLLGVGGCQTVARPAWGNPGTAPQQRMRAQRFDPYPEDEVGPPIEGSRPLGYQTPPAEVKRSRWSPADWGF